MAVFSPKLLCGAALAVAGCGVADGQEMPVPPGIDLSADLFSYDGDTNRVNISGFRLTQDEVSIEADEATANALDFESSEWRLSGNVRIAVADARAEGDEARFTFRDGELRRFELRGDPATFEDLEPAESDVATGGANRLLYERAERRLSLTENAWLRVGSNEVTGCELIYDLAAEAGEATFRSGSGECDQPFRIRVSPLDDEPADAPSPP